MCRARGTAEYAAKLSSVTNGGKRIDVGTATVDKARSTGMCRDTDPSFFAVDGSGILHDVGPAHGSGYRYETGPDNRPGRGWEGTGKGLGTAPSAHSLARIRGLERRAEQGRDVLAREPFRAGQDHPLGQGRTER
ncbi:hypothetical protein SMICM304S_03256 [Streptomyces microflavus]